MNNNMNRSLTPFRGYLLVGLAGALVGALVTALLTRAIPRMGASLVEAMMEKCFQPGGFCHEMLKRYGVETRIER